MIARQDRSDARGAGEPLSACVASRFHLIIFDQNFVRARVHAFSHQSTAQPVQKRPATPGACPPMRVQNARRGAALVANKCPGR